MDFQRFLIKMNMDIESIRFKNLDESQNGLLNILLQHQNNKPSIEEEQFHEQNFRKIDVRFSSQLYTTRLRVEAIQSAKEVMKDMRHIWKTQEHPFEQTKPNCLFKVKLNISHTDGIEETLSLQAFVEKDYVKQIAWKKGVEPFVEAFNILQKELHARLGWEMDHDLLDNYVFREEGD